MLPTLLKPNSLHEIRGDSNPDRDIDLHLLDAEIDQEIEKLISSRTEATALRSWFTRDGQKWLSQIPAVNDGKMETWLENALNQLGVLPQFRHTDEHKLS